MFSSLISQSILTISFNSANEIVFQIMKMCHGGVCLVSVSPENKTVFTLSNPTLWKLAMNPTKHSFPGDLQ